MGDRLLDLDREEEPDYPEGFIWGVNFAVLYPCRSLKEDTDELKMLEKTYRVKF